MGPVRQNPVIDDLPSYHRRRTLRKMKTAGKARETTLAKYVIRETVSMQPHHSVV